MSSFEPLQLSLPDSAPVPYFHGGLVSPGAGVQFPYTTSQGSSSSCPDGIAYPLPSHMAASENVFESAFGAFNCSLDGDTASSGQPPHTAQRNTPRTITCEQAQLNYNGNFPSSSAQSHMPKIHPEQGQLERRGSFSWDEAFLGSVQTSTKSRKDSLSSQSSGKVQKRRPRPSTRRDSDNSTSTQADDLDEEGLPKDPRRRRILERNRVAATKCRLRKRDEASALASREQAVEDQNRYLSTCFDSLTAEIYHLKTQLLRHTDCNCILIQKYIAKEAQRSVNNMTSTSNQPNKQSNSSSSAFKAPNPASSCESLGRPSPTAETFPTQWTNLFQTIGAIGGPTEAMLNFGLGSFQEAQLLPDAMSATSSMTVTPTDMPEGEAYFPSMDMSQQMVDHNRW